MTEQHDNPHRKEATPGARRIAKAYIRRYYIEAEKRVQFLSQYREEHVPHQPEEEEQTIALSAALAPFFDDPTSFDFSELFMLSDTYDKARLLRIAKEKAGSSEKNTQANQKLEEEAGKVIASIITPSYEERADFIRKMHEGAKSVAEEKRMGEDEVYNNDELYEEAVRRGFTPLEYAQILVRMEERIRARLVYGLVGGWGEDLKKQAAYALPPQERTFENILKITLTHTPEALLKNEKIAKEAQENVSTNYTQGMYRFLEISVRRFFGEEGIKELPQDLRSKIPR